MVNAIPNKVKMPFADTTELDKLEKYLRDKGFHYKRTESLPTRIKVYDDAGNFLWRADLNMEMDFGVPDELFGTLEVSGFLTPDKGISRVGMTCEEIVRILEGNGMALATRSDEKRNDEIEHAHNAIIDMCREQGNLFATSFRSVIRPECSSFGFHAGCGTMQRAFEKVRDLQDGSERAISSKKLDSWFFDAGRTGLHAVKESDRDIYEQLCECLLADRNTAQVEQILGDLVIAPRKKREQVRLRKHRVILLEDEKDNHDYVLLVIKTALCRDKRDSLIPELASFFYHSGYRNRDRRQFEDTEETIYTLSACEKACEKDADLNGLDLRESLDKIWLYGSEIESWADRDVFEQHKDSMGALEKDLRDVLDKADLKLKPLVKTWAIMAPLDPKDALSSKEMSKAVEEFRALLRRMYVFNIPAGDAFLLVNLRLKDAAWLAKSHGQESFFFGSMEERDAEGGTTGEIGFYETKDGGETYDVIDSCSGVLASPEANEFFRLHGSPRIEIGEDELAACPIVWDEEDLNESLEESRTSESAAWKRWTAYLTP